MSLLKISKNKFFYCLLILLSKNINSQSFQFNSLDSLIIYAEKNSATIKTGEQQSLSAKWTKIASYGNIVNLKSPFSASWLNNTTLPVSYLPAEAFGGPVGAFKEVSLGQQYVTSYGITPQLDIINPAAWARVRSAELNKQLTQTNNLVSKKNLFESISATYYNIISLHYQINNVKQSVLAADSILIIAKNKFNQGIIREQDVNNANINLLNIIDKLVQLKLSLEQNYNSLKILCDLKIENTIIITENITSNVLFAKKAVSSSLIEKQSQLQVSYLKSELNATRLSSFSPTLSLLFNQSWQQNSNIGFTDANANKFTSQYIGVRLSVPFPFDINRLSTNYSSKINYNIANINLTHSSLANKINNNQLDLEFEKANSTFKTSKQVRELKDINYQKILNQYNEGIVSTDVLLNAFADKINANLNYSSAFVAIKYAETKIKINNSIQ